VKGVQKGENREGEVVVTGAKKAEELSIDVTPGVVKEVSKGGNQDVQLGKMEVQFVDGKGEGLRDLKYKTQSSQGGPPSEKSGEGEFVKTDATNPDQLSLEVVSKESVVQAALAPKAQTDDDGITVKVVDDRGRPVSGLKYKAVVDDGTKEGDAGKSGEIRLASTAEEMNLAFESEEEVVSPE
jgi:hypothetical protein